MSKDISILVVDDFSAMRCIVKNLLHELGYPNVQEASDGHTALPTIRTGKFDFLTTDWNMPGMMGLDRPENVLADEPMKSMPVLIVTTDAKREQIFEAAQAGVRGYLIKPFAGAALKEKIDKILSQRAASAA